MEKRNRVLVVGSARESFGGVSASVKMMEKMPAWGSHSCYWLGTQIQRNYLWKLWYAVKAWFTAFFIIWHYDIVHFHTVPDRICLIIQLPIFLLALLWRKKIIMHIHMGNQLKKHTGNRLFLWHLRRADLIILLARRWQSLFSTIYAPLGIKTPTTYLYNCCDTVHSTTDYTQRPKSIIMAGYMDDNKAPDILLKAWRSLLDRDDRYKEWTVSMLGNGNVDKFRRLAHALHLDDNVEFPGYVTGATKTHYFSNAAIHVLCSYEEGFPMIVLEAWSYGIPVITTPVGGLPDVIIEGKNSLTFPFGSVEGLADRLASLINDYEQRRLMSAFEQQFVKEHFSVSSVNKRLYAIYDSL